MESAWRAYKRFEESRRGEGARCLMLGKKCQALTGEGGREASYSMTPGLRGFLDQLVGRKSTYFLNYSGLDTVVKEGGMTACFSFLLFGLGALFLSFRASVLNNDTQWYALAVKKNHWSLAGGGIELYV